MRLKRIMKHSFWIITFLTLLAVGVLFFPSSKEGNATWYLLIEDPRSETLYYRIAITGGDTFKLTCRNSVSKSLVTGTFGVTDEGLLNPIQTSFTAYGPGLPFDFMEEYQIEEGIIIVFHDEEPREDLRLWVTPLTEEMVTLKNSNYPLGSLTETNLLLTIFVDKEN